MRKFNPHANRGERALQAWLVLIGHSAERRTVTYDYLGQILFRRRAAGVLAGILGCIAFYCRQHKLPPLNCIVVGGRRGRPGSGIPNTSDRLREQVYRYDWFNLFPPAASELEGAFRQRGRKPRPSRK